MFRCAAFLTSNPLSVDVIQQGREMLNRSDHIILNGNIVILYIKSPFYLWKKKTWNIETSHGAADNLLKQK